MSRSIGLVVLDVGGMRSTSGLERRTKLAARMTPTGRMLAVVFRLPSAWEANLNVEEIVSRTVLGIARERTSQQEWEFFGHVGIRICQVPSEVRSVEKEKSVLLFRRQGEKAYVRRRVAPLKLIDSSRIDTLHPVFTRDVANNVWHLKSETSQEVIIQRLATLLSWPDEDVLLVGPNSNEKVQVKKMRLDEDLVGVPTKIAYAWAQTKSDDTKPDFDVDFGAL